jgi:hypothetical protein
MRRSSTLPHPYTAPQYLVAAHRCSGEEMAIFRPYAGASLWKFSGYLGRSKSQQFVTDPRYNRSHVGLKTGGQSYRRSLSAPAYPLSAPRLLP